MNAPNYRIKYKEKNPYKIILIIVIILALLLIFRPLTWLKNTLAMKSLEYKSKHESVSLPSLTIKKENLPMSGSITKNYLPEQKGINIKPGSLPTEVKIIDIGTVMDIGYNDTEKNYIKVRHVSDKNKEIYYTYYSNLPKIQNASIGEWVGNSTIIYSGNDLDYLHFEVLDFNGNNIDPTRYINIE